MSLYYNQMILDQYPERIPYDKIPMDKMPRDKIQQYETWSLVLSTFLWRDSVHFSYYGIVSCRILSCGILSCLILFRILVSPETLPLLLNNVAAFSESGIKSLAEHY